MDLRALIWKHVPRVVMTTYADVTKLRAPDRIYLSTTILPRLIARKPRRLLNLGVHYYTQSFQHALERAGVEVFTADPDDRKTRWGSAGRHAVCTAAGIGAAFPGVDFDVIVLNGVLGYGLDTREEFERTLATFAAAMRPGGLLILGWDDNMFPDPVPLATRDGAFESDVDLLGTSRSAHLSGMRDSAGRPASKIYDVLRRTGVQMQNGPA